MKLHHITEENKADAIDNWCHKFGIEYSLDYDDEVILERTTSIAGAAFYKEENPPQISFVRGSLQIVGGAGCNISRIVNMPRQVRDRVTFKNVHFDGVITNTPSIVRVAAFHDCTGITSFHNIHKSLVVVNDMIYFENSLNSLTNILTLFKIKNLNEVFINCNTLHNNKEIQHVINSALPVDNHFETIFEVQTALLNKSDDAKDRGNMAEAKRWAEMAKL
jgi:hypothetical protein